jgi:Skp family chaperone for outer membrane proteins
MEMSRSRLAAAALVLLALPLAGAFGQQQITNFCVVDKTRIQQAFFRESKRAKEYQAFLDLVKQELKTLDAEIEELERSRVEAVRVNSTAEADRLAREIATKKANRDAYAKLKDQDRLQRLADLMANDKFTRDMYAAIEYVCNQEGYAAAFDLAQTPLLGWDPEIDVTDKVIARMNAD